LVVAVVVETCLVVLRVRLLLVEVMVEPLVLVQQVQPTRAVEVEVVRTMVECLLVQQVALEQLFSVT
jgi:hypothetical protein